MKLLAGCVAGLALLGVTSSPASTVPVARSAAGIHYLTPAWSPDGRHIAFSDYSPWEYRAPAYLGDIYVMDADGSNVRRITQPGFAPTSRATYPTWSPDGTRIAFCVSPRPDSPEIYVMRSDGTGLRKIADGCFPDWSHSGRRIAFGPADLTDAPGAIWVVRPDGSDLKRAAWPRDGRHAYYTPAWSPDGQALAFGAGPAARRRRPSPVATYVAVTRAFGGRGAAVTINYPFPMEPDWSPDGRRIVFRYDLNFPKIAVKDILSGTVTTLHKGQHPQWSPDGRKIAFSYEGAIYTMAPNGLHVRRLTPQT